MKRIFKFGDTLILNALRVTDIAHESKERGNVGLGRGGRRNMCMLAPGYFVEKIKHVALVFRVYNFFVRKSYMCTTKNT